MNRLILLDSGPLGMMTNPKAKGLSFACQQWLKMLLKRGEQFTIPEIADYEVRRELLRANLLESVRCLDDLKQTLKYIPIQTDTMLLVANLWAEVRRTRQPTADPKALDRDVILAAQVQILTNEMTQVIITTTNVSHLSRLATALNWQDID